MVLRHVGEPGDSRVDMLQIIREYGVGYLDQGQSPAGNAVLDKHARYFLELAEAAVDELRGPDQMAWITRLEGERDNLRSALTHLLDKQGPEQPHAARSALRLAAALGFFWYKTGSISEGLAWLERALAAAPTAPDVVHGQALHGLGILLAESGEANRALAQCQASCALFRRAGELAWVARSLNSQGGIARDVGDLARAEQLFSESFELRRELGDDRASLAIVLGNLAIVALDRHDLARAREYANECLASAEGVNQWIHAATLQILADVAVEEGDVTEAGDLLRSAFPVLKQLGTYRLLEFLDSCAGLAGVLGLGEAAAGLVGAVDAALDEIGARMVPSDERMRERRLAPARSSLGADRFEALRRDGRGLTFEEALDVALNEVVAQASRPIPLSTEHAQSAVRRA